MPVSFGRLFLVQLCSAMCKGAMVSQFSPDLIQLAFYSQGQSEYYDRNAKTLNAIMSLAPQLGYFAGSMTLPFIKQRFTFRRISMVSLLCIALFYAVLLVPMPVLAVFIFIFASGIFVAVNASIILMWIGELADKKYRGILGTIYELFCGIGQAVCSFMLLLINYYYKVDGRHRNYYFLTFLPAIVESLLCLAFLRLIPKTFEPGPNVVQLLSVQTDNYELNSPNSNEQAQIVSEISFKRLLTYRMYLKAVAIAVLIGIWQQPSGINGICQYATRIFANYFDSPLSSAYGQMIINCGKTILTVPSIFLIERAGRKSLIVLGVGLCCAGLLLTILSYTIDAADATLKNILLPGLIIYLVGFELGPGPCNHVLNSEIYPLSAKGKLTSIQLVLFYICNCCVVSLFEITGPENYEYVPYLCYLVCLAVTTTGLLMLIPETKGKTNREIEELVLVRRYSDETLVAN